jgi:integrase/recombinase XerD
MTEFVYSSPFQEFIREVIRQKQSLGYKYDRCAWTLYKFDQFCRAYGSTEPVLKFVMFDWILHRS